jgi:hypothetical protein
MEKSPTAASRDWRKRKIQIVESKMNKQAKQRMMTYIGGDPTNNVVIVRITYTIPNCYELASNRVRKQVNCCIEYINAVPAHIIWASASVT